MLTTAFFSFMQEFVRDLAKIYGMKATKYLISKWGWRLCFFFAAAFLGVAFFVIADFFIEVAFLVAAFFTGIFAIFYLVANAILYL